MHARVIRLALTAALVCAMSAGLVLAVAHFRGQRQSEFANTVALRTARLAGYATTWVGANRSEAVLRLQLPSRPLSAADVELGWQTGMAILTVAYPRARDYRVDLMPTDGVLLAASGRGRDLRAAVAADDPAALRRALGFAFVVGEEGPGMPSGSWSSAGREDNLDASNLAAGLATIDGPAVAQADGLKRAWKDAYRAAPGIPAPSGGAQAAGRFWADRITSAIRAMSAQPRVKDTARLTAALPRLISDVDVTTARAWAAICDAVASTEPVGARVLGLTAAAARAVEAAPAHTGPSKYNDRAWPVTEFERVPSFDASGSVEGTSFPAEMLARYGTEVGPLSRGFVLQDVAASGWEGLDPVAPDRWLAYRGAYNRIYWLAGEGGNVALADSTLHGWGYEIPSARFVDASDCRKVVAVFPRKSD